jgi:hypothetical protein
MPNPVPYKTLRISLKLPTIPYTHNNTLHTLANPNDQLFKPQCNVNTPAVHVPQPPYNNSTATPNAVRKLTALNTNGFLPTITQRHRRLTNGNTQQHDKYINQMTTEPAHKTTYNTHTEKKITSLITRTTTTTMSANDEGNSTPDTSRLRGRRGGRAPRGRIRGRRFRFSLSAHTALTHYLLRKTRCQQLQATDAISITVGNLHDAPLNARRLDKNVYPPTADRDNILTNDPIYLYHPAARPDLHSPLALTPLVPLTPL